MTVKIDLDQLTNRQMYLVERAAGMRFREITTSDILQMAATAWLYLRENGLQQRTFDELLDMTPQALYELLGGEDDVTPTSEGVPDADPPVPPPTTP